MKKKYSKEEIIFAGKIGEVSSIDIEHVVSLLDEAVERLANKYDCRNCVFYDTDVNDKYFCSKGFKIFDETCQGKEFEIEKYLI